MIESQDQFPDLGKVAAHAVDPLGLEAKGLHKLQTLVDGDWDASRCGPLLTQRYS